MTSEIPDTSLKEAMTARPWDPEVHDRAARAHLERGNIVAARQEFARARALGADNLELRVHIGVTYLLDGRNHETIRWFEPLFQGGCSEAAVYIAAARAQAGDRDGAAEMAKAITMPDSPGSEFWTAKAIYHAHQGDQEQAAIDCNRALEVNDCFLPARFYLGQLYQQAGKEDKAEECFRKVYEKNPRQDRAIYNLAVLLCCRKQFKEAEQLIRRAFKEGLDFPGLFETAGFLLKEKRRYEAAIRMFERMLEGPPVFRAQAVQQITFCRLNMRDYQGVVEYVDSLSEEDREMPLVVRTKAVALECLGKQDESTECYGRYTELCPQDAHVRAIYALAVLRRNEKAGRGHEESFRLIDDLERDFPGSGYVDYMRGFQEILAKNDSASLRMFSSAVEKLPHHADAHYWKGELTRRIHDGRVTKEVFELWRRTTQLNPRHEDAWLNLARNALYRGNKERARALAEKALSHGCNAALYQEVLSQC